MTTVTMKMEDWMLNNVEPMNFSFRGPIVQSCSVSCDFAHVWGGGVGRQILEAATPVRHYGVHQVATVLQREVPPLQTPSEGIWLSPASLMWDRLMLHFTMWFATQA